VLTLQALTHNVLGWYIAVHTMKFDSADDARLIGQIARGQESAVEALYDRYNRLVFSVALAVVGDRAVAEEVTLDVFVHAWRGAKTYDPARAKVSTWLVAIARHHAIDVLRWQNSRVDSKSLLIDDLLLKHDPDLPDPEEQAELSMERRLVQGALSQLPTDQRQALFLSFFKGFSHQQIADLLTQPLGTVKTRIRLAMRKLRQILVDVHEPSDTSTSDEPAYRSNKKE
jgi:RNA polymerase sigma-70 factor (ECF subfamily)